MWRDIIADNAEFSLDDALDMAQFNYRENLLDHWGLQSNEPPEWLEIEDWLECRRVYGVASAVADSAISLLRRRGHGLKRLQEGDFLQHEAESFDADLKSILQGIVDPEKRRVIASYIEWPVAPSDPRTRFWIFHNTLQLKAAEYLPYSPARMAERFRTLIQHLVTTKNYRAREYLSRVARCFILDMVPELAVMARAVLDVLLQDLVTDEAVEAEVGGVARHVTLSDRLRYCESMGLLEGETAQAAKQVKAAGDEAAHGDPGKADAVTILESLATVSRVLTRLERDEGLTD